MLRKGWGHRALLIGFLLFPTITFSQNQLSVRPVYQLTPVWCWAAVGEMVFDYYGVANLNCAGSLQCAIIALVHPVCDQGCFNCPIPAGSLTTMNNMLNQYPVFASRQSGRSTRIATSTAQRALSLESVKEEIDEGRPIVAGISPSGYTTSVVSEHVALIVGYDGTELVVNDPFPFGTEFRGNPYIAAGGVELDEGQYKIAYSSFIDRLKWRETIYRIRCTGSGCRAGGEPLPPACGRSCQTSAGRCGPFFNQPPLPLSSPCWCGTPYGPAQGRVVRP
jgi:hypothetical protein